VVVSAPPQAASKHKAGSRVCFMMRVKGARNYPGSQTGDPKAGSARDHFM